MCSSRDVGTSGSGKFAKDIAAKLGMADRADPQPNASCLGAEILGHATRVKKLNELVLALSQTDHLLEAYRVVAQCKHFVFEFKFQHINFLNLVTITDTREIIKAARVSVSVLRDCGTILDLHAVDGAQGDLPTGIKMPVAHTMIGKVITTRAPVRVADTAAASSWRDVEKLRLMGMRAAISGHISLVAI